MTTLAEINDTLAEQNDVLYSVGEGIDKLNSNIQNYFSEMQGDKLDQLEADREAANEKRRADKQNMDVEKSIPSSVPQQLSNPFDFSGFGGIGKLFGAGSLLGIGAAIGKTLLARGIPALVINGFADEIANYVESESGSKELGDAVFRGLKLGSIGLLFGKKFGLIGAAIGAVLTDENRLKLGEIETSIRELGLKFDIELPNLSDIIKGATTTIGDGLDFINATLKGDLSGMSEDFGGFVTSILGITALLAPGSLLKGAIKTTSATFKAIKGAMNAKALADVATSTTGAVKAIPKWQMAARLAPFIANPVVLGALGVGALAWFISALADKDEQNANELKNLQDRVKAGEKLTDKEYVRLQTLDTSLNQNGNGGGLVMTDNDANEKPMKFTPPVPESKGKVTDEGYRGSKFNDPRLVSKKPLEKPDPISANKIREEVLETEKNKSKPIVVIQEGGTNVQTTNVQTTQGIVAPFGAPIDHGDPLLAK